MGKMVFMFPGQGAQYAGMGKDFYEKESTAKEVFDKASHITGLDVAAICFEENDRLSVTEYTQIAMVTVEVAILKVLEERGVSAQAAAGLSLGEYGAIVAAGAMRADTAFAIVRRRGVYMQEAVPTGGAMAAVLGLPDETVEAACREAGGIVLPVNYNSPGQLVIAGERSAVEAASAACKAAGARRVMPLAVSGAFHTPMMQAAAAQLRAFVEGLTFQQPKMPIYTNLTGERLSVKEMPLHLEKHMVSPVRWTTLFNNAIADGFTSGCEIGPGKTLTGFARKINPEFRAVPVETFEQAAAAAG